jgi:hypothetical protein
MADSELMTKPKDNKENPGVMVDAGELALLRAVKCAYDMIVEKAKIESALPKQVKLIEQMQRREDT